MSVVFPGNPTLNEEFVVGNILYIWDGDKWNSTIINANFTQITGATGIRGIKGDGGPSDDQGATGATGVTGDVGPKGDESLVTGPQGDGGPKGATGATGPKGATGIDGVTGDQGLTGPALTDTNSIINVESSSATDNQVLQYNNSTSKFETADLSVPVAGYGATNVIASYKATFQQTSSSIPASNEYNWESANLPPTDQWRSVTYGDGKFVAVANFGTNQVMYSTNGINWTSASAAENANWQLVTYGDGKFVAVASSGTNLVMYSTDGINWTSASAAAYNPWGSVVYADGKFVAVASGGFNRVMYSTDGINWTLAAAAEIYYQFQVGAESSVTDSSIELLFVWRDTDITNATSFTGIRDYAVDELFVSGDSTFKSLQTNNLTADDLTSTSITTLGLGDDLETGELILTSPNSTRWKITIGNSGNFITQSL